MNDRQIRARRNELDQALSELEKIPVANQFDTARVAARDRIFQEMDQLMEQCRHRKYTDDQVACPSCGMYRPKAA